ncbi:hypothetical protein [Pseudomonas alkylphenolica]|uniref:hypothetical protein n=1 Tax=Pseudomonas alkylphenolica TaxID=237609 RepID=UPI000FEBD7B8|nr:hypothetical protein [Pseudomonas alkylphenolica]
MADRLRPIAGVCDRGGVSAVKHDGKVTSMAVSAISSRGQAETDLADTKPIDSFLGTTLGVL